MPGSPPTIRRYTLCERLGAGGGGEVWAGLMKGPAGFRKQVAVKLVQPGSDDEALLRREARMGALLRHPNIVDVYELGRADDGRWFLAMELVPGPSLNALMRRMGALPGPALREIGIQVARGLAHAHHLVHEDGETVGLVHRDIKPGNVLLDPSGMVKVSDLGIARLAGDRIDGIEGTPGYLSPEQLKGGQPSPTADVFSVGVMLWAMAVGQTPIRPRPGLRHALSAAIRAQEQARRVRATFDDALPGLAEVILRCLDPNVEARFATGRALRKALRDLPEPAGPGLHEVMTAYEQAMRGHVPEERRPTTTSLSSTGSIRTVTDDLVGRTRERDAIERLLAEGPALVTLKGLGGMGKTRLAAHVANRWKSSAKATKWVDLGPVRDRAGILSALAATCRLSATDDATATIGRALHALHDGLLVLDGPDDVLPDVAELVDTWRGMAPQLRVIVTARQATTAAQEAVVELGPLTLEESVVLYRARYRGAPATESLSELVRPLGGLPLAIELAARGDHDRSSPSDGLADTLARSFEQLAPWSQHALGQLAAFRGTFTVEAAEAVVDVSPWEDAPWPLEVVDDLWRRSLLYVRPTKRGPRLGVLPPVRDFVQQRLKHTVGLDEALRRHGDWFARFGDPAWLEGLQGIDGEARIRQLARELDDIVVASERAVTRGDAHTAVATCLVAWEVLRRRGPMERAQRLLLKTLALPDAPRRDELLGALAEIEETHERYDEAIAAAPSARRRARRMAAKARFLFQIPELEACVACATEALALGDAIGDAVVQGRALIALGVAERHLGRPEDAMAHLVDGAARLDRVGCRVDRAYASLSLGNLYYLLDRHDDAEAAYLAAEAAFRATGMRGSRATAIANLTLVDKARGDYAQAERRALQARELHRAVGDHSGELSDQSQLAGALAGQGRIDEAIEAFREAAFGARSAGRHSTAAMALVNLSHWLYVRGRGEEARGHFREAAALARQHEIAWLQALAIGNLGILASELDHDPQAATAQLDHAIELATQAGSKRMQGGFLAERVRARIAFDEDHDASLDRAQDLLEAAGDKLEVAKVMATRARLRAREGNREAALHILGMLESTPGHELEQRILEARSEL